MQRKLSRRMIKGKDKDAGGKRESSSAEDPKVAQWVALQVPPLMEAWRCRGSVCVWWWWWGGRMGEMVLSRWHWWCWQLVHVHERGGGADGAWFVG